MASRIAKAKGRRQNEVIAGSRYEIAYETVLYGSDET